VSARGPHVGRPLHGGHTGSDRTKVPHTLLLADDSVTIQRVIELTFADEDIKVVAVSTGDQAIEKLDAAPPDIVLADVGMPGKNGYEVVRYIRQTPRLSHIPVVLLTGAFEPVDQARASEAGCDGVLAKPFEPQLVIGRVKELLAKGRTAAAPGQWASPIADRAFAAAPAPAATGEAAPPLDDYFDRLDAAFSNRPAPAPAAPENVAAAPQAPAPPPEIDWFAAAAPAAPARASESWDLSPSAPAAAPSADLPLAPVPPQLDAPLEAPAFSDAAEPLRPVPHTAVQPAPVPVAAVPAVATPAPQAPSPLQPPASPFALPSLGDAFAALLAAEQSDASPAALAWPGTKPVPAASIDELVADVTRRVLDTMSDRVVRDTVADLVSQIAERLVREEIDRIKSSVK